MSQFFVEHREWVLASQNAKKIAEFNLIFGVMAQIRSLAEFTSESIAETGTTFVENTILKAVHGCQVTNLPCLADDSGLVVPALDGAPGLYSARYAGQGATDADNNAAVIAQLQSRQLTQTPAYYHCSIVLMREATDPDPLIAQGQWWGMLRTESQGMHGFGYDPIFYPAPNYSKSASELMPEHKAKASHRGLAVNELLVQLKRLSKR